MNQRASALYRVYQGLITLIWSDTIILQYVRAAVMRLPYLGDYPDVVISVLYVFFICGACGYIHIYASDCIFVVGSVCIYLLSGVAANSVYWQEGAFPFLVQTLPLYLVGSTLMQKEHRDEMLHLLYLLSLASVVLKILYTFTMGNAMDAVQSRYQGDMDAAYKLLPHVCLVMLYAFRKSDFVNVPVCVSGVIFLTMLGTRGPVLVMLLFAFYCMITRRDGRISWIRASVILLAGIGFVYSSFFAMAAERLRIMAMRLGLSVRIFEKILNSGLENDSGRGIIQEELFAQILTRPVTGYGLFGDRGNGYAYAHQLFIELWTQFGIILGTIIGLFFLSIPIIAIFRTKDWKSKGFLILLYGCGVVKLFLSGSYLNERMLFLLLGCSAGILRESHEELGEHENSRNQYAAYGKHR